MLLFIIRSIKNMAADKIKKKKNTAKKAEEDVEVMPQVETNEVIAEAPVDEVAETPESIFEPEAPVADPTIIDPETVDADSPIEEPEAPVAEPVEEPTKPESTAKADAKAIKERKISFPKNILNRLVSFSWNGLEMD